MATTTDKQASTSHIPDDISLCILSKLPLKSLKRFTCVKKSWSLLFQDPNFINMFRTNFFISNHHENEDERFLFLKGSNHEVSYHESLWLLPHGSFKHMMRLDWPSVFEYDEDGYLSVEIVGSTSVNGFFCLYQNINSDTTITVMWNPFSSGFYTVPPSHYPYENIEFNYGPEAFGYDTIRDDYKLIRQVEYPIDFEDNWVYIPNKDDPFWETDVHFLDDWVYDDYWEDKRLIVEMDDPFWEIYSFKSNSWRKLDGVDMSSSLPGRFHVNSNEFSHWLVPGYHMVSFDFCNETFFTTSLPSDSDSTGDLVMLNGSVSLISDYDMKFYYNIWILGEIGEKESWTKLFVVGPLSGISRPIGAAKKSQIFFRKINNELACFDCSTQSIVEFGINGNLISLKIVNYR